MTHKAYVLQAFPPQSVSKTNNCEQLLDEPFDQLMSEEWEQLKKYLPQHYRNISSLKKQIN